MNKILIVSGHTNLDDSIMNKQILNKLKEILPQAEFDCLDKLYSNYKIDVLNEQKN